MIRMAPRVLYSIFSSRACMPALPCPATLLLQLHANCTYRHNVALLGIGMDGDLSSDEDVRSTLFLVMEFLSGSR